MRAPHVPATWSNVGKVESVPLNSENFRVLPTPPVREPYAATMLAHGVHAALVVAGLAHPGLQWLYFTVLWAAILSTAVVSCYGVATRIRERLDYRPALFLILSLSLILARLQFSSLVRLIYPLFGGVGVLLLAVQVARATVLRDS